ncbi:MAG TPA: serine/threonine-protein kinase [Noviherbaspirillum sp.]|nr:serine/threonine-protein kinase [Noviherbaspirillum sp.]
MSTHAAQRASSQNRAISRVGRFHIIGELGRGSTGHVNLAHDPVMGRNVALKVLNPGLGGAERQRHANCLINEARAAGRLSHPHIVTIYDASNEGGMPYIAMEHLQGRTLHQILAEGRRYCAVDTASIALRLAGALDHAHAQQVVHRDVKPANIFMVNDEHPKLLDFGIARAPNRIPEDDDQTAHTLYRPNAALGTPNYMSPEQAQGKPVDERSDIYSLGAVMYQMLAGRTPFEESDPDKLLQQIAHKAPRSLHEAVPGLHPELCSIVTRAMAKRPEKRYQSAAELGVDLKRFLSRVRRAQTSGRAPAHPARAAVAQAAEAPGTMLKPQLRSWQVLFGGVLAVTGLVYLFS